jgi:uncharacterized protein
MAPMDDIIRVGVVSDTHIPHAAKVLPKELLAAFEDVHMILHAGDHTRMSVIRELEKLAPVWSVAGNTDGGDIRAIAPEMRIVEVGDYRIGMWHGYGGYSNMADRAVKQFTGHKVDVVVFGHTHGPWNDRQGGILRFNPGSATSPRFTDYCSFGILSLGKTIDAEIVPF